jgi:predicted Zn-dependent protease
MVRSLGKGLFGIILAVSSGGCGLTFSGPLDSGTGDLVASSTAVVWVDGTLSLAGELVTTDAVDVFDLGALASGTRLTVEVVGSAGLDPVATVFDAQDNRFAFADDVDYPAGELSAVIDEVVRHASDHYLLAIAGFGIPPKPATTGSYTARVTRSDEAAPSPAGHTFVVRYQGGSGVFIDDEILGRLGPWDVPAFDPQTVIPTYADAIDTIKPALNEAIREIFAEFDLTVITDDDADAVAEAEPVSGIYLVFNVDEAAFLVNRNILGVARADAFNRQKDDAIFVFVEGLAGRSPNADMFVSNTANLIAHEMGHTLGLLHVDVPGSLLNPNLALGACCALLPIRRGPMVEFPIGFEDQALLLEETLGRVDGGM